MTGAHSAGAAKWLHMAAMPTFAAMALLTGLDASPMHGLCTSGNAAPFSGMAAMYWLMSAFHSAPWLNLITGAARKSAATPAQLRLLRRA